VIFRPTSVIICTRNRATLLPRVVRQLRAQDYPRDAFEIIIVDNASVDDTAKVVRQLSFEPGASVRYVFEGRCGVTRARNLGAVEARYPYLAYIDDDCSVGPKWLAKLMSGFELHGRVVAVGGLVLLRWDKPRPSWLGPDLEPWFADTSRLGKISRLLDDGEYLVESNTAFEKKAWQAAGGFIGMEEFGSRNLAAGEVLYLLHELRKQGGKIAFVPEALMYHHISSTSRKRILLRGYWQGVSDAMLAYLFQRRSWVSSALHAGVHFAAFVVLVGFALLSYARLDEAKAIFNLTRAFRRIGLMLSETHLVGDWNGIRACSLNRNLNRSVFEA
jgi:glycosyltransferase involved in cell wall biosynthesis